MNITVEDIKARLSSLGYSPPDSADNSILYGIRKTEQYIKTVCNISEVPESLRYAAIDMVCGEFLREQKNSGWFGDLNADLPVSSIKQGDTSTTYAVENVTPEGRLDALISRLTNEAHEQLIAHRRLRW